MTVTLSKAQIEALKVELGKYGLSVSVMSRKALARKAVLSKLDEQIARVQGMTFKTAGLKKAMLDNLKTAKRAGDWKAANPGTITELLAMFGRRLEDVQPWADTRWECLRNATGRHLQITDQRPLIQA